MTYPNPGQAYLHAKALRSELPTAGLARLQAIKLEAGQLAQSYAESRMGPAERTAIDALNAVARAAQIVVNRLHESPYAVAGLPITVGSARTGSRRAGIVTDVVPGAKNITVVLRDGTMLAMSWRAKVGTYQTVGQRDGYTIGGIAVDWDKPVPMDAQPVAAVQAAAIARR